MELNYSHRLEASLRGDLFSEKEVAQIKKFMKVAMVEQESSKCTVG